MTSSVIDPELHAASGHESTRGDMHVPFHAADDDGAPLSGCVFMTGGPRDALPHAVGLLRRLRELGSRHPAVLAVASGDATHARTLVSRRTARVMRTDAFPRPPGGGARQPRSLDLLNVLGAPFRRVVWLSPEVLPRRNLDDLCALNESALYATAAQPRRCFDDALARSTPRLCAACAAADECRYELDGRVLVAAPLSISAFNEEVVAPVTSGALVGVGSGGAAAEALNALVYARGLFGGRAARMPAGLSRLVRWEKER